MVVASMTWSNVQLLQRATNPSEEKRSSSGSPRACSYHTFSPVCGPYLEKAHWLPILESERAMLATTMRRHATGKEEEDVDSRGTLELTDDDDDDDDDDVCEDDATIEDTFVSMLYSFSLLLCALCFCENIAMKTPATTANAPIPWRSCTSHPQKLCLRASERGAENSS